MTKNKIKEIAKVATASALSIAVLGGAFMATNHLVFASTIGRTLEVPAIEGMPTSFIAASLENYGQVQRNLNVTEDVAHLSGSARGYGTISAEQAAQALANRIYEQFGEDIDGADVYATFNDRMTFGGSDGVWSMGVRIDGEVAFAAIMCANTGHTVFVECVRGVGTPGIMMHSGSGLRIHVFNQQPLDLENFEIEINDLGRFRRISPEEVEELKLRGWRFDFVCRDEVLQQRLRMRCEEGCPLPGQQIPQKQNINNQNRNHRGF
ncbi:MAG: hypothetical protein FWE21_03605 [Defluviitaleaceae bacterium]|nr:hypothetical protein [Defluviitaleaceae bacterium]